MAASSSRGGFRCSKISRWSKARSAEYEMSVDANFIVQRHPALENVWLVGGGSGHGYKHGIMLGEYVANRVLGKPTDPALEPIFKLKAETFS